MSKKKRKVVLWDTYSKWDVPQRGKKRSKPVVSSSKERKAIENYVEGTLRVAVKATRKGTNISKQQGIEVRRAYYEPKEYVSRRFIREW